MSSRGAVEFKEYASSLAKKRWAGKELTPVEQECLDQAIIAGAVPTTEPFRWRTSKHDGNRMLLPSEMETRHVFFTLAMIWNHSMPEEARTHNYKKYKFGSYYTAEYMVQAIHALSRELATRKDMEPHWKKMLEHMLKWLGRYQLTGQYLLPEK